MASFQGGGGGSPQPFLNKTCPPYAPGLPRGAPPFRFSSFSSLQSLRRLPFLADQWRGGCRRYDMVSDPETDDIVSWNQDGKRSAAAEPARAFRLSLLLSSRAKPTHGVSLGQELSVS